MKKEKKNYCKCCYYWVEKFGGARDYDLESNDYAIHSQAERLPPWANNKKTMTFRYTVLSSSPGSYQHTQLKGTTLKCRRLQKEIQLS